MWEMIMAAGFAAGSAISGSATPAPQLHLFAPRVEIARSIGAFGWARLQPVVVPLCTTFPGNPVMVFEGGSVQLRKPAPVEDPR